MTKVYFPRLAIPTAAAGAPAVDFLIAFGMLLALMAYYGIVPGPGLLLAPLVFAVIVLAALGVGTLLAALNVAYRDFRYVTPFLATTGMSIVNQINERSLNLEVFQDVENSVLDLYSAVRNGYLQRRRRSIEQADAARHAEWHPPSEAVATR